MDESFIRIPFNLPEFRVLEQQIDQSKRVITLWIESCHVWARCPACGKKTRHSVGDDRWRKAQDLSAMDHQVVLQVRQRRMYCEPCQRRFYETFDSVDVKQRQTQRLQAHLVLFARGRSLLEAAKHSAVTYRVLRYLYLKWGRQRVAQVRPFPRRIGVDEFAIRKGQTYATVIIGLTWHQVWGLTQHRTQEALEALLRTPGACTWRVKEAVIDMWEPFFLALQACLKHARIIIDRFHVERHLYHAVDACRKRVGKGSQARVLKQSRQLFLTAADHLGTEQRQQRDALLHEYPELAQAVHLADRLHRWYSIPKTPEQANHQLTYWLHCLMTSGIPEFIEFAQMVKRWRQYIINYFVSYSTNGPTEGFNTKFKLIKRLGYGRLTFYHLAARIILECGHSP